MANEPQPSDTEKILGRSPDAPTAEVSPADAPKLDEIDPRWRKSYQKLIQIRDYLIDQHQDLGTKAEETEREFITQIADAGTESFLRDYALGMVSNYQEMIYEVDDALQRIAAGTYGVCELTGKPISPERLDAVPWTRFSVEAEQQLEDEGKAPFRPAIGPRGSTVSAGTGRAAAEARKEKGP